MVYKYITYVVSRKFLNCKRDIGNQRKYRSNVARDQESMETMIGSLDCLKEHSMLKALCANIKTICFAISNALLFMCVLLADPMVCVLEWKPLSLQLCSNTTHT